MKISVFPSGILQTNCYTVEDELSAVVIDPGFKNNMLDEWLKINAKKVKAILLTHFHADHIAYLNYVETVTKAPVYIHETDNKNIFNSDYNLSSRLGKAYYVKETEKKPLSVKNGRLLKFNNLLFEVIHTPGHTSGSCCYLINNNLFSGDTLFYLSYGRTDLITSSFSDLKNSLKILFKLPNETVVYAGHGEKTTIGFEKNHNPILESLL